jgi:hypothetical protein
VFNFGWSWEWLAEVSVILAWGWRLESTGFGWGLERGYPEVMGCHSEVLSPIWNRIIFSRNEKIPD